MSRSTATASVRWTYSLAIFPRSKPSKARQHNQAWLITTWLWVSGFFCAVWWCPQPTEEWIVNLFPACWRSTPMFPALCVMASAAAVLPVTNASPERGFSTQKPDFDKAGEPTFGRNPRPAHESFYRRPVEQPDGLSQGFAAVAISANLPHFMSWTSALTENCSLRLSAYVSIYINSNLLLVACPILILFFAPALVTFSRIFIYM